MSENMPSKMEPDEYESDDLDDTETMISRSKSNRPKSALGFTTKKASRKSRRRPGTPGKGRAKSASSYTGKDLWMNAVKKRQTLMYASGRYGDSPRHKTPVEYWVDTLRKTGSGISTESTAMNTLSGLKKGNDKFFPYMSTSHFLRQSMGLEKAGRYDDPTVKASPGRPAYKTQEEYYDEVLELRKQIAALNHESATVKTKMRRLEEDNTKKEKEIESLLNPEKSEEIRRAIGDRKPDSGAVIHSLKQRILKLEMQLRDKETAYSKLQADLKVTKVDELKVQMEALYQEILRLQNVKDISSPSKGSNDKAKIKALNETVLRLSRTNEQLLQENKSLKEDLQKAMENDDITPKLTEDFSDMNRKQMLFTIASLKKRAERAERELDSGSLASGLSGRLDSGRAGTGKLVLEGSLEQRLTQLDHRETELLEEIQRLKATIKRLREERRNEKSEAASLPPTPRRRSSVQAESAASHRPTSARSTSSVRPPYSRQSSARSTSARSNSARLSSARHESGLVDDNIRVQEFTQNHAATSIQRTWRQRRKKQQQEEDIHKFQEKVAARKIQRLWREHSEWKHQQERVEQFRQNHAAKKIQNEWLNFKHKQHTDEVDDAAYLIQGAMKSHHNRLSQIQRYMDDRDSIQTDDDDVYLIQSSLRSHHARLEQMKRMNLQRYDSYEDEDEYYDTKSPSQSRSSVKQESSEKHSKANVQRKPSTHTFEAKYSYNEVDDDDDIMF